MKFLVALSIAASTLLVSCQTMGPKGQKNSSVTPGMSALEVTWVLGKPDFIHEGVDEAYLIYGSNIYVLRNGHLSHVIASDTPTFGISADAIRVGKGDGKKISIHPKDPKMADDIYFNQYSGVLARALTLKGYKLVDGAQKPDMIVVFDFHVDEEKEKEVNSVSVPVTSYTWNSGYSTYVSGSSWNPYTGNGSYSGYAYTPGSQSTTLSQQQQIVTTTKISYNRHFEIEAREATTPAGGKPIWKLSLQSDGATKDRRKNFAVLTSAALDFVGVDSKGEFTYFISANDPVIQFVEGSDLALAHYTNAPRDQLLGKTYNFRKGDLTNKLNEFGQPPILSAVFLGSAEVIKEFVKLGSDPSCSDYHGKPLLAHAVDTKNMDLVREILTLGANPKSEIYRIVEKSGRTTSGAQSMSEYAKSKNAPEIAELLEEAAKNPRKPAAANGAGAKIMKK